MENRNVISGYDNGEFRPENYITRAEFAAMIAKYADLSGTDANVTFDDIGGHWAYKDIMEAAVEHSVN